MDHDNRRRQFRRALLVVPAILFAVGLGVWFWGMNYDRVIQVPNESLVRCGLWLMVCCGGIYAALLVADWSHAISFAVRSSKLHRKVEREQHRAYYKSEATASAARLADPSGPSEASTASMPESISER